MHGALQILSTRDNFNAPEESLVGKSTAPIKAWSPNGEEVMQSGQTKIQFTTAREYDDDSPHGGARRRGVRGWKVSLDDAAGTSSCESELQLGLTPKTRSAGGASSGTVLER